MMLKVTQISATLFVAGMLIRIFASNSLFAALEDIGFFGLLAAAVYYAYRLLKWLNRKLLWKVRNKIIVSYAFVGIIPVLILAFIGWEASRLVLGQLSGLYLEDELGRVSQALHRANEKLTGEFYRQARPSEPLLFSLLESVYRDLPARTSVTVFKLQGSPDGALDQQDRIPTQTVFSLPRGKEPLVSTLPIWTRWGFEGLVWDSGALYFRTLAPLKAGTDFYLTLWALPFDQDVFQEIERRTSIRLSPWKVTSDPAQAVSADPQLEVEFSSSVSLSGEGGWGDVLWIHPLNPMNWEDGQPFTGVVTGVVLRAPVRALYNHYFAQTTGLGPYVLYLIVALGVVFVVVEVISFFIGVAIARRITGSVHHLDEGTRNIQRGNFGYRIPVGNRDQLDSLAEAFNQMGASILRLMAEVSEKEWLEKEIEIAREVQAQLFPQRAPSLPGLQLAGSCLPARRVSGDYYDFIPHGQRWTDVIVADISGKGISAALLMAGLQSSVRAQILYGSLRSDNPGEIARAVAEINRQLYRQTPPDKFATLVLSRFDVQNCALKYSNAGHNPPLLFTRGEVRKLDKGGTVAGLFENSEYEEETQQLLHNDVIVFYTDGVVESENSRGEEFGEERLIRLVQSNLFLTADDIHKLILDEVCGWMEQENQKDDVTVVVLKTEKQIEIR